MLFAILFSALKMAKEIREDPISKAQEIDPYPSSCPEDDKKRSNPKKLATNIIHKITKNTF